MWPPSCDLLAGRWGLIGGSARPFNASMLQPRSFRNSLAAEPFSGGRGLRFIHRILLKKNSGVPEELIDRGQLLLLLGGLLLGRLLLGGLLGLLLRSHGFNSSIVRPGPSDSSPPPKNTNNMNYLHFELQI
jgi:hypothetical protein